MRCVVFLFYLCGMDFTEYLVPQNVNDFARTHGFTHRTIAYTESRPLLFDQFFDWAEEKWGLFINVHRSFFDRTIFCWNIDVAWGSTIQNGEKHDSARAARIAACEALIDYVSSKA